MRDRVQGPLAAAPRCLGLGGRVAVCGRLAGPAEVERCPWYRPTYQPANRPTYQL